MFETGEFGGTDGDEYGFYQSMQCLGTSMSQRSESQGSV